MQNYNEQTTDSGDALNAGEKIIYFIQKNRKIIFISLGIIVVLFAGLIAFIYLSDNANKKDIAEVEELNSRFSEIFPQAAGFYEEQDYSTVETDILLADLITFSEKRALFGGGSRGFAGSRAWSLIAQIYSGRKNWPDAEEAWLKAARIGAKTYLGPIALFNAAAAAEEQGRLEQAIEYLQNCLSHSFEFSSAPRAQFSIGRIYEKLGDNLAAVEAYRNVLINWPNIPVFSNLARTRIIAIEVR